MRVPDSIKHHQPTQFGAAETRSIDGYHYGYLVSSRWDAAKGRPQKTTGKRISKITGTDGCIPNANGWNLMREKRLTPDAAPGIKGFGAYEHLRQFSPQPDEQLKKHFPELFREIQTAALLRLVDGISSLKVIQPVFLASYLTDLSGDLALSETPVRKLVSKTWRHAGSDQCLYAGFRDARYIPSV